MTCFSRSAGVFLLPVVVPFLFAGGVSRASNNEDPEAPLAVRAEEESRQLRADAQRLHEKARAAMATFQEKLAENQISRVKPRAVGQTHVAILQLDRLAQRLVLRGEPAGADLQLRAEQLGRELQPIVEAYLQLPGVAERVARDYKNLVARAQPRAAVLSKAKQLADRQEWEKAASALHGAIDELETTCVWFSAQQRRRVPGDLAGPLAIVEDRVRRLRKERARELLAETRRKLTPDFDALLGEVGNAITTLRARSNTGPDGESHFGPNVLRRVGEGWQQAQHQAVECLGLDWARGLDATSPELRQLVEAQSRFSAEIGPALAELIEADAARSDASQARELLVAYLERLAPLVALSANDSLADAVASPLAKLAAKSPELAEEVGDYRTATADVLRWRRRTAAAYARARGAEFPPIHQRYLSAFRTTDSTAGFLPANAVDTSGAEFATPVPDVMRRASEQLIGSRASLEDLVGLPTTPRITVAHYHHRGYAQFSVTDELADRFAGEVTALEADLLVNPSAPPLTLEAAVALFRARRGDLAAAGGEIVGISAEPLVTRFATLSTAGRSLVPLGPLPTEPNTTRALFQVVVQFEIRPTWLAHEYFFVETE